MVEEFDGTELTQKIMSAIVKTGERFGAGHIVDVLRGGHGWRVIDLGHDRLSVYGTARDVSANNLKDAIDQLVDVGLIERATGVLPILSLTADGKQSIKGQGSVTLVKRESSKAVPAKSGSASSSNPNLFEKLRRLRKEIADELNMPAYIVFHNSTLHQMASKMPVSLSELARIRGVGPEKLQRFGDRFVAVIAAYRTENRELSGSATHLRGFGGSDDH